MTLLDLFCGAGGAGAGYARVGFEVEGVDLAPQPRYPYAFRQGDALQVLLELVRGEHPHVTHVHASPPCQRWTKAQKIRRQEHPDLVAPTRLLLEAWGGPYVIENVPGAPLIDPIMLCGAMFGLRVYRHRLFESNVSLAAPPHPAHVHPQVKMGRPPKPGEFHQPVGNFSDVQGAREAMDVPWMMRDEIREAIPPAYTEHIGRQLV